MGALDFQLGVKDEVTYGTPVTVDRFFEYQDSASPLRAVSARTEGMPFRVGSRFRHQNRAIPYVAGAEGTLELDVLNKGFGFWLRHMFGTVGTTGAGPYTHTGTEGDSSSLMGDSFTAQLNYPLHPAGTDQALTFAGGKVKKWTLANTVDQHLRLSLDCDFASVATGTALATASYPSDMDVLSWSHGVVSIGGSAVDLDDLKVEVDNGLNTDRRQIRGDTEKKEPTPGPATGAVSFTCDWDALTQHARVHTSTVASMYVALSGVWTSGTDVVTVTAPVVRLNDLQFGGDPGGLKQTVTGTVEWNGTDSGVSLAYTTSDATP